LFIDGEQFSDWLKRTVLELDLCLCCSCPPPPRPEPQPDPECDHCNEVRICETSTIQIRQLCPSCAVPFAGESFPKYEALNAQSQDYAAKQNAYNQYLYQTALQKVKRFESDCPDCK